MSIDLPQDTWALARQQAASAGFPDVDAYVANLITQEASGKPDRSAQVKEALERLKKLREELPKFSREEIVEMVRESRRDLP